ncbi:MAG: ABC transporter permease subunit, partial [Burkholderiales bacterium]|nr:ABC transporter permease subunit [Burkholderiales bacterium]
MSEGLHRIFATFFDPALIVRSLPELLSVGLPNTLMLSLFASAIGITLGLLVAAGLMSERALVRLPWRAYVDVLRGLPHILTVYLIGQGLPLAGLSLFGDNTYGYAALAIGLIESAYFAEI